MNPNSAPKFKLGGLRMILRYFIAQVWHPVKWARPGRAGKGKSGTTLYGQEWHWLFITLHKLTTVMDMMVGRFCIENWQLRVAASAGRGER